MTLVTEERSTTSSEGRESNINNFSIMVGTKNGSGSQTSNLTILRALFQMGIPISGKNIFPSNIQGLPTWYTIRLSRDGYVARRESNEVVVAMNLDSFAKDVAAVAPGGIFLYGDHLRVKPDRDDIQSYALPANTIVRSLNVPANLRDYTANMVYVGVLTQLLGIDLDAIHTALDFHFNGKASPVRLNFEVIEAAITWAKENIPSQDRFRVAKMDGTKGQILADGNTAAALGAVYGGVQLVTWYPITPASSLAEALSTYLPRLRKDPETGKNTFAVVQAEDELAAIGMAIGGGWSGLRAMTSTSGPGISLMTEFSGLAYFSETPVVVWDVQRMGPSTGLPTRTSQGDITQIYYLGHGDTQNLVLIPGSVNECFEFGWRAFDISEQLQAPVFVLSDLDMGMNQWMTTPFEYPAEPMNRGKVLWEPDLEKRDGKWGRYLDEDGDGITYRTLPGNKHPRSAWFARGTGHDDFARYTEDPDDWDRNMERLERKYQTALQYLPKPTLHESDDPKFGLIAFGSTDPAIMEARDELLDLGVSFDYLRVRSLPLASEVRAFTDAYERVYVIEMNHTGQLCQILRSNYPNLANRFISLTHNNGLPLSARWIRESILEMERSS